VPAIVEEQRMLIRNVRWKDYVLLRAALETPGLRMTFYKGALELMSPSKAHESQKKMIARMVELYTALRGVPLFTYGSTTFRREAEEHGAEPDECYCVGHALREGDYPDIVLEVIHKSPLLDKLAVHRGFDVREVWLFRDGAFEIHRLADGAYTRVERSALLSDLDLGSIARLATRDDQAAAIAEWIRTLA
jgi:Uma2 family endonuclease